MISHTTISDADKNFLLAVRDRNYPECTRWLSAGANVNAKFGKYSEDDHDGCSFCGPNDTALTHAVKKDDKKLVKFLLINKASTEVYNCDKTPLMTATFCLNVETTKLLLDAHANPNAKNTSGQTAMHFAFLGLREWLLHKQKNPCTQTVILLMKAGFSGNPDQITNSLRTVGEPIRNLFTQIWMTVNNPNPVDMAYGEGAASGMVDTFKETPLPTGPGGLIGSYLNRRDGGIIALTCKAAMTNAILWKNLKTAELKDERHEDIPLFQHNLP